MIPDGKIGGQVRAAFFQRQAADFAASARKLRGRTPNAALVITCQQVAALQALEARVSMGIEAKDPAP